MPRCTNCRKQASPRAFLLLSGGRVIEVSDVCERCWDVLVDGWTRSRAIVWRLLRGI